MVDRRARDYRRRVAGEIAALETSLLQAMADGNRATLERHLADDFVITTAGWLKEPSSRSEWLDGLSLHALTSFRIISVDERHIGTAIVALVLSSQQGELRGTEFDHEFRYTDVWTRDNGRWQLAVRHASIVRALPA
jgi:hypothetical protein